MAKFLVQGDPSPQKSKFNFSTLGIGGVNGSIFAAGQNGELIRITNNAGARYIITAFSLFYNGAAQDNVEMNLIDVQKNRPIFIGNVQFCAVGMRKGVAQKIPVFPLEIPFYIDNGNSVSLLANNVTASPIAVRDVSLTLYGKQVFPKEA